MTPRNITITARCALCGAPAAWPPVLRRFGDEVFPFCSEKCIVLMEVARGLVAREREAAIT